MRNFLIRHRAWSLNWPLRSKLSICFLKVKFLSIITLKRVTSSLDWTQVKLIFNICSEQVLPPKIINQNFLEAVFQEHNLNHFNMFLIVHTKILFDFRKIFSTWIYSTVISKITNFWFFYGKEYISLMNILNNNGSDIENCGIFSQISDHIFYMRKLLQVSAFWN